jgi:bla regulator protein BlaR1
VMAAAIWLACRQWPRMPANLRVALWWLVSLKFVIGLVWTQPIPLPILPAPLASSAPHTISLARSADEQPTDASSARDRLASNAPAGGTSIGSIRSIGSIGVIERIGSIRTLATSTFVGYALAAAVGCWLTGILLQGALLLRQLVRTRRLISHSLPVEGDAAELFDDLVARLDLYATRPRLRVSTGIATPQVTGLTRPVILLPVGALESFTTRELSLTLCHELMHVQRFDLWHGWIPSIAARLFFFHPLAHLAAREYAIAREAACDARVLAFMQAPAYDYGRLLMRLGVTARESAPAAAGASPTLRTLKRRLLMLHDASPNARRFSPRAWALTAIAAMLVLPIRPTAQQPGTAQAAELRQQSADARQTPQPHERKADPKGDAKGDHGDSWVFLQEGDTVQMHASSVDLEDLRRLRANSSESLIWFKREGRAYVIRDKQMLDRAHAVFIHLNELSKAQRMLEERQTMFRAMQKELSAKEAAVRQQVHALNNKVDDANDAVVKATADEVNRNENPSHKAQLEANLREADERRHRAAAHREEFAARQREIGKQQKAVGAEQEAIGRQQEHLSRSVEWEMRTLFEQALAAGLATPVK